jgi:hypothetical protein
MMRRQWNRSIEQHSCSPPSHPITNDFRSDYMGDCHKRVTIASQHAWMMVLLPRSNRKSTTTTTMDISTRRRRSTQQHELSHSQNNNQLWKPTSPYEEYTYKGRSSQKSSKEDALIATATAAAAGSLKSRYNHTMPPPPPLYPARSATVPSPLGNNNTTTGTGTSRYFTPLLRASIPHEIHIPSMIDISSARTTPENPAASQLRTNEHHPTIPRTIFGGSPTSIENDDVHSDVSLDYDFLMTQLQLESSDFCCESSSHHDCLDHALFQPDVAAGNNNASESLFPSLSKCHHNSSATTSHYDSVWGITTTTLDDCDHDPVDAYLWDTNTSDDWPSDEDDKKQQTTHRRRRHTVCGVISSPSPKDRKQGSTSTCRGDERRLRSPGFTASKTTRDGGRAKEEEHPTPQSCTTAWTAATTLTPTSRDDDAPIVRRCRGAPSKRESCSTPSVICEKFHLSRSNTDGTGTTASSSTTTAAMWSPMVNLQH